MTSTFLKAEQEPSPSILKEYVGIKDMSYELVIVVGMLTISTLFIIGNMFFGRRNSAQNIVNLYGDSLVNNVVKKVKQRKIDKIIGLTIGIVVLISWLVIYTIDEKKPILENIWTWILVGSIPFMVFLYLNYFGNMITRHVLYALAISGIIITTNILVPKYVKHCIVGIYIILSVYMFLYNPMLALYGLVITTIISLTIHIINTKDRSIAEIIVYVLSTLLGLGAVLSINHKTIPLYLKSVLQSRYQ